MLPHFLMHTITDSFRRDKNKAEGEDIVSLLNVCWLQHGHCKEYPTWMCVLQHRAQTVWSHKRWIGLWTTSRQIGHVSLLRNDVGINCGWGSSVGGGGGAIAVICFTTIGRDSPLGLPLPFAALTLLPPLEHFWRWCRQIWEWERVAIWKFIDFPHLDTITNQLSKKIFLSYHQ